MGRAPCCDKANVKKGPWSPEEDAKLKDYIDKFGTGGNWIALPQKAGLRRCGKSCRLRWLNYLRPNIKHGEFSGEEDRVICALYATIGSRWSIIAAQLPGRTDNDIKNYWNTKLKKKLIGLSSSSTSSSSSCPLIQGHQGKFSFPFPGSSASASALIQTPSYLSQLYTSLYSQSPISNHHQKPLISAPQANFLYSSALPLQETTGSYSFLDLPYLPIKDSSSNTNTNMLVFGNGKNEHQQASCSSSDGSCGQISYAKDQVTDHVIIKQEDIAAGCCNLQGFGTMLDHWFNSSNEAAMASNTSNQLEYDLEEVKLITSGNDIAGCNNSNYNNNNAGSDNSFLFSDENKTDQRGGMDYYY